MKQLQMLNMEGLSVLLSDRVNLETKRENTINKINELRLRKEELYQQLLNVEENISELFSDVYKTDTSLASNKQACVKLIAAGSIVDLVI